MYLKGTGSTHHKAHQMNEQRVVFRKWRDTGSVIALFPEIPTDLQGWYCEAYEHVGQHGGADYHGVIRATRPAKPTEYRSLANELDGIGYRVKPVKRASSRHHEQRRKEARSN